ncbi:efflux RND transporter permease subunit [uncultured Aquimonas sp.]|uniref:efflux RND transporter permease subunit n=1 Tax=uncultured Aquimonas sp. TaxID=385483 RepID=UPI00086EA674|nr:efflux RND transporter permease subunit [uncultured Aquimonas sp.]ODU45489.1 MAG: acriflavin resistance protein [Xanthomonadaceae bacterium SCN 69-123]
MNIAEIATRRRVTVGMVTITFLLFGFIALRDLKVNLLPDLSYPTLTVRTEYTGAAPTEIENLITEPVEEAVGVVKNLRRLRSVSRTGQSDVILEFAWGTDMDRAGIEVRDKLELLRLPLEAEKPVLLRFDPSTEPIMRLGLAGRADSSGFDVAELKDLRRYADETLKKRLEPVDGVAAVKVSGGLEDEVQVLLDPQKLARLNLTPARVIERLKQENINISGGAIDEGNQRFLVRTVNQFANVEQMQELLVAVDQGVPVRLRDVASVGQGFKEREAIIRMDGREAVELAVYKEGDANTVAAAAGVREQLDRLRENLPANASLITVDDQSVFIQNSLDEVSSAALMGGLLAVLIIFFFLRDGWSTFVIAVSLPVSIIATFFFMQQVGLSLNVMSLGGLALATGMVVDDSIVVLESIAKARERGLGVIEAAIVGASEVRLAVVASTLTTVAVFFPLVFVEGVAGQLFGDQALTVSIAIVISTVVAMALVPMLASLRSRPPLAYPEDQKDVDVESGRIARARLWIARQILRVLRFVGRVVGGTLSAIGRVLLKPYDWLEAAYRRALPKALARPAPILLASTAAFVFTLALVPGLGMDLIPQLAQGRFEMTVKLPPGTPLAESDAVVRELQRRHAEDPRLRTIHGVSGSGTRLDANPTESGENIGKLLIVLADGAGDSAEAELTEVLRESAEAWPRAEVKFSRPQLFSFATPLEIEIRGYDLEQLRKAGQELARRLQADDRYADVKSTVEQGFPEIQVLFDAERAAALNLTTRQIADQVVRQVRGEVATRYSFRNRKIDVLVRAEESARASAADIGQLIVNPESDRPVRLSAVAEILSTEGPSEIHRVDQERVAVVSANLRYGDLGTAVANIERMLAEDPLGAGLGVNIGGQNEELQASVNSLIFALVLAIFMVYLVMASQFESLLHPFVIMFTIPLAAVGAILALKLVGSGLSVVVFIGLILLAGIVVKNAIVLIDRVNQLREEGVPKLKAIVDGSHERLRPIVMTTLTTLFGFLPLAIGGGEGAEVRAPMAITVIGGLLVSTLLTLLVIPVVYKLLDRKPDGFYFERGERARAAARAEMEARAALAESQP